jgi:hypothetical protein
MPREVIEGSFLSDHARILAIRAEASELLQKLDDHDLIEAAAAMAPTIDVIDASLRRLDSNDPSVDN